MFKISVAKITSKNDPRFAVNKKISRIILRIPNTMYGRYVHSCAVVNTQKR